MLARLPIRLLLVALVATTPAGQVRADTTQECVSASERAQDLRDKSHFVSALGEFYACARATCPKVVRVECARWAVETEAAMPTLILGARDVHGHDLVDVRASLDGVPLVARLDGRAVAIDPGPHVLRFEAEGKVPVEKTVLVREAEKGRHVDVVLVEPGGSGRGSTLAAVGPSPARSRWLPLALGGLAVASAGGFAYFGLRAATDVSHMRSTCAPSCDEADVSAARHKAVAADVLLGMALVSGGMAIYTWLRPPSAAKSDLMAGAAPVQGGGSAWLVGRF